VYHALTPNSTHLALKIYKTSILIFKDRDKYVTGEYRFRRGYSRHNPRKMVRLWAEKEMRNLKRLLNAGIRCPEPIEVRENVLVMGFLGDQEGWCVLCTTAYRLYDLVSELCDRASPRLKDAQIPTESCDELYAELVLNMRKMYHRCKLVHADLSEYNILYHESHLYIIDVSQSVEHDHPSAFDFLRNDIKNTEDFFGRLGVRCLGLRRCFEFVTKEKLGESEEAEDAVLMRWLDERDAQEEQPFENEGIGADDAAHNASISDHEDSVFRQSYIPRSLNELYDPERDVAILNRGEGKKLIYSDTIGLVEPFVKNATGKVQSLLKPIVSFEDVAVAEVTKNGHTDEEAESDEGDQSESNDDDGGHHAERKPRGHRHEDRDAKKVLDLVCCLSCG
jgi:RIO kinase 1